jgi:signal recognition particle receptor subunit beta
MLQNGAIGLVLLIDNGSRNPFDDLDVYLKLLEGFIENTGVVIGINRSEANPAPTIHDYHSHLAKGRRDGKAPPPIMEVAPGNRQEMKKLLLSLLFHLNPSL